MNRDRRLYLENDYILQELEALKREIINVKNNIQSASLIKKDVNVIINSNTEIVIGEIPKNNLVIVNITSMGTTNSVCTATISAIVNGNIMTEQSIFCRDNTTLNTVVFKTSSMGECKILIKPIDELVPLKVDKIEAFIINNIEGY